MIRLITGVMASGKSEELIRQIEACESKYLILKPSIDSRNGSYVKTRAHKRIHSAVVVDESNPQLLELLWSGLSLYDNVFIDEVQFFSADFIERFLLHCLAMKKPVLVSGLIKDFKMNYFPSTRIVLKYSDTKAMYRMGLCYGCGEGTATVDVLMDGNDDLVTDGNSVQIEQDFVESEQHYESLCTDCYDDLVE